jgi:spermidine synthase
MNIITWSIVCLGISSVIVQFIILREFLTAAVGNELVLGLILGTWTLLTGLGSLLGHYGKKFQNPFRYLSVCQLGVATIPIVQVIAIRHLKAFLVQGTILGISEVFWASIILLLPYCLLTGFMLPFVTGAIPGFVRDESSAPSEIISKVYIADSIGFIIGGALFSLVLVFVLTTFQTLILLFALNGVSASMLLNRSHGGKTSIILTISVIAISIITLFSNLDYVTKSAQFPGQTLILHKSTPYGELSITKDGEQTNVYQNGVPYASDHNIIESEESVHYAMSQHDNPKRVLLISGGVLGAIREVLKYPSVELITLIEQDNAIIDLVEKEVKPVEGVKIELVAGDARHYLRTIRNSEQEKPDIIMVNLPDPTNATINRYYTWEFFKLVKDNLSPQGIFGFSLSGGQNYLGPHLRRLSASIYGPLKKVFPNVIIVPSGLNYYLASKNNLTFSIGEHLSRNAIKTHFVNSNYLKGNLTSDRIAMAKRSVQMHVRDNSDFFPISYLLHLRHWLEQFGSTLFLPTMFIAGVLMLTLILLAAIPGSIGYGAIASSGFSGMGLQVIMIMAFQIFYGHAYQQFAMIITAFLGGAALGAHSGSKTGKSSLFQNFLATEIAITILALTMPFILESMLSVQSAYWKKVLTLGGIPILNGLVGALVGRQFAMLSHTEKQSVSKAGEFLYTFDFLGASLGAILVSAFLVPTMGIKMACIPILGVKLISLLAVLFRGRSLFQSTTDNIDQNFRISFGPALSFGVMLFILIALGMALIAESTAMTVYALSLRRFYHFGILAILALGILQAAGILPNAVFRAFWFYRFSRVRLERWISFILLALVAFFPIFRCYFKIPYIFCHACPRKCIFGILRPYLIPATLIMNLDRQTWCYNFCPIGILYGCQSYTFKSKELIPPRSNSKIAAITFGIMGISSLIFTVVSYFQIDQGHTNAQTSGHEWYAYFFTNSYTTTYWVVIISSLLLAFSFLKRRSFCIILCPIGVLTGLWYKLKKKIPISFLEGGAK